MYSQFNIASHSEFRSCSKSEETAGIKHSFTLQAILQNQVLFFMLKEQLTT